jgi:DNA (cytosine-5)-methyltransferase 1
MSETAILRSRTAVPQTPVKTTTADLSGWPLDTRERGDFYHAPRAFPPSVAAWRRQVMASIKSQRGRFGRGLAAMPKRDIRSRLDAGIAYLREVARILAGVYGTPDLGNKQDPVDELVYIILARKTREDAYQAAYASLKKHFASWDDLLDAPRELVTMLVHSGGLSGKKTTSLYGALTKLRETFGSCTLEPVREWSDEQLERFLCSLPEISRKSAYCIMMYSLGRDVFPVDTHVGRVLARLRPYRELGVTLAGLDHKKLQAELAELVPPNLRYSLHVNLVAHGREVCRAVRPICERCEVRNLCATYREREITRSARRQAPTVVDLFCGAGGLSEGFRRAGFRVVTAVDSDPVSIRTYWLNHPDVPDNQIVQRDITTMRPGDLGRLAGRRIDVLLGAPPCQGFSHVGFRSKRSRTGYRLADDRRNFLWKQVVKAALELRPRLVVMENVPGMNFAPSRQNVSFMDAAGRELERHGYRARIWRMNAAAFGVPQDRLRYFLVAGRHTDLPSEPRGEYKDIQRPDHDVDALPAIRLDEAILDLPSLTAGTGTAVDRRPDTTPSDELPLRRYLYKHALLRDSALIYNHHVRYHNVRDLELYRLLRPGEDSVHMIERHGRADLMRYRRDVFDDKYHKLRPDRPSKTIVAHLAKDGNGYVHPYQDRSITVREAARLQSFHDGYVFCGAPSDQWVQVGNAVPPLLAEAIARTLLPLLRRPSR